LGQFASGRTLAMPLNDLQFQFIDLTIELFQMIEQALGEQPK